MAALKERLSEICLAKIRRKVTVAALVCTWCGMTLKLHWKGTKKEG